MYASATEHEVSETAARTVVTGGTTGARFAALDGLRGLAAISVVLLHFATAYRMPRTWWLAPFTAGTAAVLLFFVLSGFVLSLPFWRYGSTGTYGSYLTRRFFRIWVPYLGALLLAIAPALCFTDTHHLFRWYYRTWQAPLTPALIARHLLVLGSTELNPAFWSLRFEVQWSILFPALLLLLRAVPPVRAAAGAVLVFALAGYGIDYGVRDPHLVLELLKYGALFAAGALLARMLPELRRRFDGLNSAAAWSLFAAALVLYFGYADDMTDRLHLPVASDLLVSLGAVLVVLSALLWAPLRGVLEHRILQYLGRISYSVYLLHGTILFTLLALAAHRISPVTLGAMYLMMTFGLSHLFCILVEEPALRLGRTLAARRGWNV